MKAMVCEMCGSHDLVKQDGVYVCQSCGTKYSVEEAKKLIGTVKVDKTEETEKLLVLARRAREENNSENAEKYYGMILQEDPNNWEAYFFQVYFRAMQCRIMDIASAAQSIANCMNSTMKMISDIPDNEERNTALNNVILYSQNAADVLATAAKNHWINNEGASKLEAEDRVFAALSIYTALEKAITDLLPLDDNITKVQKGKADFMRKFLTFFRSDGTKYGREKEKNYDEEMNRLTQEIKKKEASYEPPQKPGCYVATCVYGSYDCPEVWTLRRYRDYDLAETWYGRAFIYTYYTISPTLVKWFGHTDWFKKICKGKLDMMVKDLQNKGYESTPYEDCEW